MLEITINTYIYLSNYISVIHFFFQEEEPSVENLDVDYEFFNEKIWPRLAHRVPVFENIKVSALWVLINPLRLSLIL